MCHHPRDCNTEARIEHGKSICERSDQCCKGPLRHITVKKKKAPKRWRSFMISVIVFDRVLFPVPAKPCTHKTFYASFESSAIHSIMSLMTLRLVFLRQGVWLYSSISSGFLVSRLAYILGGNHETMSNVWMIVMPTDRIDGGRHLWQDQFRLSQDQCHMQQSSRIKILPKICERRAEFGYLTIDVRDGINDGSLWLTINHATIMRQ